MAALVSRPRCYTTMGTRPRRRLARLVELGLVRGFWAANSQRPRGRYAYELTRPVRQELEWNPEPGRRRFTAERPAKSTIHELATNDLLGAFLRAAEPDRGLGLVAWLPERAVARLFDGYVRPDALAVVGTGSSRITLFIERDLGTEGSKVVAAKVAKYATLLGARSSPPISVGIVVENVARSMLIRRAIGGVGTSGMHIWVTASAELVRAPYDAIWTTPDDRRCRTFDLPAEAGASLPVMGASCLLDPDSADAFELAAIELISSLRRFVRTR